MVFGNMSIYPLSEKVKLLFPISKRNQIEVNFKTTLHISEVREAVDGIDALAAAEELTPDLVHEEECKQRLMMSQSKEKVHLLKRQIAQTLTRPNWNVAAMTQELAWLSEPNSLQSYAVTCMVKLERDHPELKKLMCT